MTGNSIVARFAAFPNLLRILVRPALPPKHPDLHTLWLQAGAPAGQHHRITTGHALPGTVGSAQLGAVSRT